MKLILKLSQFFFAISVVFSAFAADINSENLCVDIGASSFRYLYMPKMPPKDSDGIRELASKIVCCRSLRPLTTDNVMKALPLEGSPLSVFLGLPCPCTDGEPVPASLKDLKYNLCRRFGSSCRVMLANDGANWLRGALVFQANYREDPLDQPSIMMVLGTAVALAYFDGEALFPLEIGDYECALPETRKLLGIDELIEISKVDRYLIVGKYFFEEGSNAPLCDAIKKFKNLGSGEHQYQALVNAYIADVVVGLKSLKPPELKIEKTILAGGNARHLGSNFSITGMQVMVLNSETLNGIPTDIIPLLALYHERQAQ